LIDSEENDVSLVQIEINNTPGELDVREIAPRERHELIFATLDRLTPGQAFVLINDHDPKPLYYQFQAEQPGKVSSDSGVASAPVFDALRNVLH
jgi:uncharacterized protein (DUF2249 family)